MMRRNLQLTSVLHRCTSRSTGATPPSTISSTFVTSGVAHRAPAPPATSGRICMFGNHATTTSRGSIANAAAPMIAPPTKTRSFASLSTMPFAVDAPNGDHDFQDLEESSSWVERTILVASVTEDADAITEMHDAVLGGKRVYAVDGPDGEHDFEDLEEHLLGVNRIINQASVLENPEKVIDAHQQYSELAATEFYNAKY